MGFKLCIAKPHTAPYHTMSPHYAHPLRITASAGTELGGDSASIFFFQAEDGIRVVERSRGLGDVYKRQDYWGI